MDDFLPECQRLAGVAAILGADAFDLHGDRRAPVEVESSRPKLDIFQQVRLFEQSD